MSKTLKYIPRVTQAKTVYVELDTDDHVWLKTELIRWLARMAETQNDPDELWRVIHSQYWSKRTRTLPKSKTGLNSPSSYVGGLINNLVFGEQRDFTERQLEGIRDISAQLNQLFDDIEAIQFRIAII
jgi:hypothetical protein